MASVTYYVALPFMRDESGEMVAKSLGTFKLRKEMKEGEGN